jgi:hypothetical protein
MMDRFREFNCRAEMFFSRSRISQPQVEVAKIAKSFYQLLFKACLFVNV